MDLTTPRWHPTKYHHHLVTSYLSKAKEKHKPETPITICTPFFLEDLASSTRSIETDFMLYEKDLRKHQLVIMPVKLQTRRSATDDAKCSEWKGKWTLYITIRGETMLSRFPGERDKGNLVILIIGDRDPTCENEILQMMYRKAKYRLKIDCPVYGYHVASTDEMSRKYILSNCTRYVDWVKGKSEKEEWMNAWRVTSIAEAVLRDTTKTIVELLKAEGEVLSLDALGKMG
ncbi:hypothetical protein TWF730_001591 [Orbilia blumenaviensis]|uniref:Uncharacterized protein n=1 Tax=Orbilia blumenaviensis TaxID=1796055 RepID=A0AAV9UI44_9PEZI